MTADSGELKILGVDVAADPQQVQDRIGYMPQKFGLYEDLSVQENLDLYADLHGVTAEERRERYPRLMEMTALGPFTQRLAGRLSGGMKQKLGLACTLIRSPELLLLDEPTVGVDPLSRRELWEIIRQLVHDQGLTVLLSTSYLDEAERCGHVMVMHQGKVLAQGRPSDVSELAAGRVFVAEPPTGRKAREFQARLLDHPGVVDAVPEGGRVRFVRAADTDSSAGREISFDDVVATPVPPRFEDGFMVLLQQRTDKEQGDRQGDKEIRGQVSLSPSLPVSPSVSPGLPCLLVFRTDAVVQVRNLVRQFGSFVAVDHISFDVQRGEIFGLLGPNGAGKTTTFRMLCGLLPATSGTLRVAGVDLRRARASARQRIGYVAQKFSLYGQLSVTESWNSSLVLTTCGARANEIASSGLCGSLISHHWLDCRAAICPAGSSSGWRWLQRCCTSRRSFSSMSPLAAPTLWPVGSFGGASPRWQSRGSRRWSRLTSWWKRKL